MLQRPDGRALRGDELGEGGHGGGDRAPRRVQFVHQRVDLRGEAGLGCRLVLALGGDGLVVEGDALGAGEGGKARIGGLADGEAEIGLGLGLEAAGL